jgi:PKD repeat protein
MLRLPTVGKRRHSRGQSVVEFALMLPIFLLLIFGGIDFGRVFLGWINLNNTARIAANYAASNAVALNGGDPVAVATYNKLVTDDATATNCTPPTPLPPPTYAPDTALGSNATVTVTCSFRIFTPIVSSILGSNVSVTSSAVFPIRKGAIAGVPTGGGPAPVVAGFTINPTGGVAPQTVTFVNTSTGPVANYAWDFEGDGIVDYTSSDATPPAPHPYTVPGTYHPSLTVTNGVTPDTATKTIVITAPVGPVADFDLSLSSPTAPSTVTFTNKSTGSPTSWAWKFGDGSTSTLQDPPTKTYPAGTWTVELKVDNALGTSTTTKTFTVAAPIPMCVVPDFKNQKTDVVPSIQSQWQAAGFNTTVIFNPSRPPEYKITKQSLAKDSSQVCAGTVITVFDH